MCKYLTVFTNYFQVDTNQATIWEKKEHLFVRNVTESLVHALGNMCVALIIVIVCYLAFVTSRIDHCNSLLFGLPDFQLNKLQRVLICSSKVDLYGT